MKKTRASQRTSASSSASSTTTATTTATATAAATAKQLRVAFVHPDLGIGGAERLVVDAAVALQRCGHHVVMFTSHHDKSHCFQETRDGTLDVRVHGDALPRTTFGYLYLLWAILRSLVLACTIVFGVRERFDVIIVDQLSISIPILRRSGARILFYCHFPDKLLTQRTSVLKRIYRAPLDWLEERTTAASDRILVNSRFTASIFRQAFPSITAVPAVLYPSINFAAYDQPTPPPSGPFAAYARSPRSVIVSINRFERKKNVALAVEAFVHLQRQRSKAAKPLGTGPLQLILAGGYDVRVRENVDHLAELKAAAAAQGLTTHVVPVPRPTFTSAEADAVRDADVVFLPSFTETERAFLLSYAQALVYTPSNEHFGIVPIEAMYARLPVVAVNSGGPTESVVDGETGFLVPPDPAAFATALGRILEAPAERTRMGENGRTRVRALYSLETFGATLNRELHALVA